MPPSDVLARAERAYDGVVRDPRRWAAEAAAVVDQARREGPVEALVVALRAQAWAERLAVRNASASALLDEAVALAGRARLRQRLGEVLVSRVAVLHELGRVDAARRDALRAAPLLDPAGRAELLFQTATVLLNTGRLSQAATDLRALLLDDRVPVLVRAKAGNNLARVECELGRDEAARAALDLAEPLGEQAGATVCAYLGLTRAWVEVHGGRLAQSLRRFTDAELLYDEAGLPLGEHHLERADALAGLRLLPEALEAARAAVAQLPVEEVSLMAAEAQLRVAQLCLLTGRTGEALTAAGTAKALLRTQRRAGWVARAALVEHEVQARVGPLDAAGLADLRRRAGELQRCGMRSDAVHAHLVAGREALRYGDLRSARRSLRLADRLAVDAPVLVRLRGRVAAALLAELDGRPDQVLGTCRAGLLDLDRHRQALPSMELRALASAHGAELGDLGLQALAGAPAAAVFGWLERTRAAALAPAEAVPGERVDRELAVLRALYAEAEGDVGLPARVAAAETAVRRASWAQDAARPQGPVPVPTAAAVRRRLGPAVLVEYGVLRGELLAAVLSRRGTRLVHLGSLAAVTQAVDALLFALRRLAEPSAGAGPLAGADPLAGAEPSAGPDPLAGAARSARVQVAVLRRSLVQPLGLPAGTSLVVVPVGDLQRTPWAPLHDGPVTVAPSARTWLRARDAVPASDRIVLVAGPGLPGGAREVLDLQRVHPGATVLLGSAGAPTADALHEAGLAHLACHGRLRTDNPTFSALLLGDGPLTVHELSRRGGAPHRVVLAACDSGVQVAVAGGEALGAVAALLARGTAGVVASAVVVPDVATRPLMLRLHAELARGATLPVALWTARGATAPDVPAELAAWYAFDAFGGA